MDHSAAPIFDTLVNYHAHGRYRFAPRTPSRLQFGYAKPRRDRPGYVPRRTGPSLASGMKRPILPWAATESAAEPPAPGMQGYGQRARAASSRLRPHRYTEQAPAPTADPQQRHLRSRLPHSRSCKRSRLLSRSPGGRSVRGFRRAIGGSSNAYDRPRCGLLPGDCSPVGVVAVLSPADTMRQVHGRDASLWVVPDWLVRVVPLVRGNRMAGAPRRGDPAHARLGHRPNRKAAAARRTRGRNGPRASLRSSVR